jgi:OOP family OmpA-OmpF porin
MVACPIFSAEIVRLASFGQSSERGIMKKSSLLNAAGLVFATPAFAQTTTAPGTTTTPGTATTTTGETRWPHEKGFWGHVGLSFGQSKLDEGCVAGFPCDDKDQAFKLYAGGRFNNTFGLEVGALNFGKFSGGGGETDGWGADAALIAGIPIGANSAIFAKAGVIYARTEVSGTAPGLATGKERGFGGRWGVGGQLGLTKDWALRADFDRYRIAAPGDHRDLETLMLGVQYTIR